MDATAIYSCFDNQLTIDLPTATIPQVNYPLFNGKTAFDNYGNLFNGSLMAKRYGVAICKFQTESKQFNKKPKEQSI
ncbi:hypothetical protein CXF59_04670 [Flavobacterium sp. ALD4]|uniref:hypothetical protein n=1 Tax=Flavobacterium sp. ALD4 TaxID=2058314 RepID=UPI000C33BDC0|nr:hypothetical protein [Flavobacterium sp. ALD4]PKH68099.1 hypothetical protein CXF59_04670 [Flavobacterium sp. ALD4]